MSETRRGMLKSPRNKKILVAGLVFTTGFSFLLSYALYESNRLNPLNNVVLPDECQSQWCVMIYGNTKYTGFIPYSMMVNGSNFTFVDNVVFNMLNSWGTTYTKALSGIALDDVFNKTGILNPGATMIQFEASDNYNSYKLPISVIINNPGAVLLVVKESNTPPAQWLESKEDGGDGPVKGAVKLEPIQSDPETTQIFSDNGQSFVYNSVYNTKWCVAIHVF